MDTIVDDQAATTCRRRSPASRCRSAAPGRTRARRRPGVVVCVRAAFARARHAARRAARRHPGVRQGRRAARVPAVVGGHAGRRGERRRRRGRQRGRPRHRRRCPTTSPPRHGRGLPGGDPIDRRRSVGARVRAARARPPSAG